MVYPTQIVSRWEQLPACPTFAADNFLWNSRVHPPAFGRMAYLPGTGLCLHLTCQETDPKRECTNHHEMVCKDSAMEVFFAFPDPHLRQCDPPENDCLYLNFEVNANGAMFAKHGHGRQNRQFITTEEYVQTGVKATIMPERWEVQLTIPDMLLARVAQLSGLASGDKFFFNFYKISEDPAIEHYGAYNPIPTEHPNFHLPAHFAIAKIV